MKKRWSTIFNTFTLMMPYFIVFTLFSLFCRQNNRNMWMRSPFKFVISPVVLPNGYHIFWSWSNDPFWLKDITEEVYLQESYEHFFSVKESDIVVDVGANIGLFSLKASKIVGADGRIVAFEPEKNNYKALRKNLSINKCDNVIPINVAVSNFNGISNFFVSDALVDHKLSDSKNELKSNFVLTTEVNVKTISKIIKDLGINTVDFLKIDAEGSEFEVLAGAQSLLKNKTIKKLSVAVYHSRDEPEIIGNYLRYLGYNVLSFRSRGLCNFEKIHIYGFVGLPETYNITSNLSTDS